MHSASYLLLNLHSFHTIDKYSLLWTLIMHHSWLKKTSANINNFYTLLTYWKDKLSLQIKEELHFNKVMKSEKESIRKFSSYYYFCIFDTSIFDVVWWCGINNGISRLNALTSCFNKYSILFNEVQWDISSFSSCEWMC